MHASADAPHPPDPAPIEAPHLGAEVTATTPAKAPAAPQPRNPLHGLTLQAIVEALVTAYGWPGLAERLPVRCFQSQPSVKSSLTFLRKTPWAREKVEGLYLFMLREQKRSGKVR